MQATHVLLSNVTFSTDTMNRVRCMALIFI